MLSRFSPLTLTVITANIVVFGAVGFLWLAIQGTIARSSESIEKLEAARAREQNMKSLRATIEQTKKQRDLLASYFIAENEAVEVLEAIESIGRATNVLLEISSVVWREESHTQRQAFVISIHTTGLFSKLYQALGMMERLPYKMKIEKVAFLENNPEHGDRTWEARVTLAITSIKEL